jgi:phosphoglycerate kinase
MFFKLKDFDFSNKRVLVRVDFNVPVDKANNITDDSRIKKTLPTLKYILDKKPKQLIIISHFGRPEGEYKPEFSLKNVAKRLQELLLKEVYLMPIPKAADIPKLPNNKIIMLDNLRFDKGEEANDDSLAKKLADFGDLFVFDAFGVSHRDQASVTGVPKYIPACAGLLMEKEVEFLKDVVDDPKKPFTAIIGGAKEDKIAVIDKLINKVDNLIVGGVLANTFMTAKGQNIGASKFSKESLIYATKLINQYGNKIHTPVDFIVADRFAADASTRCAGLSDNIDGWMIMDIGPYTIAGYKQILSQSKTVIWAGPIGVFEFEPFKRGTLDIATHLAGLDIIKVIGGGDSSEAIEKFGLAGKMSHVSTGGGASLELLSGKVLPGVKALEENYTRFKEELR